MYSTALAFSNSMKIFFKYARGSRPLVFAVSIKLYKFAKNHKIYQSSSQQQLNIHRKHFNTLLIFIFYDGIGNLQTFFGGTYLLRLL